MTANLVNYWRQREDARHNFESEVISKNSLAETIRHNKAMENLTGQQIGLGYAQLAESKRHNLAAESANLLSITETSRHNQVGESISRYSAEEVYRHNFAMEGISQQQTDITNKRLGLDSAKFTWDVISGTVGGITNTIRDFANLGAKYIDAIVPF